MISKCLKINKAIQLNSNSTNTPRVLLTKLIYALQPLHGYILPKTMTAMFTPTT